MSGEGLARGCLRQRKAGFVGAGCGTEPPRVAHVINLDFCTLGALPASLSVVTQPKLNFLTTQVINLDFCTLGALPASLSALTALTTLDVEGNLYLGAHFRPGQPPGVLPPPPAFPAELGALQALRYLNLNSCGLTELPPVRPRGLVNCHPNPNPHLKS